MAKPEEIFRAEGTILHGTAKAVLFRVGNDDVWIPLSQLYESEELFENNVLRRGANVEIRMTEWIARKVGLK
jgi:hypothetical protein